MGRIRPVLLSGGSGTRLWPLSRESYPKQLLALQGERTLLQQTALRVADPERFEAPIVICSAEHRFIIAEQLRELGTASPRIVLEPVGRNTAPATAAAALLALRDDPDAVLLVLPTDHTLASPDIFLEAASTGAPLARAGKLVLFGIVPRSPKTGYGYINVGRALAEAPTARAVSQFAEKPDRETAAAYVASGDYLWNSGMFLLSAAKVIEELERYEPELVACCRRALENAQSDLDFLRLGTEAFAAARNISLDHAVMQRTSDAVVLPLDCGWSDIGNWTALWEISDKDDAGNVLIGDVAQSASRRCYLRSDGVLLGAVGVEDLVVVATRDAVLVTRQHDGEEALRQLVAGLKQQGRAAATQHLRIHRPWGYYEGIHTGERFQVKRLTVNPGCKLSLQKHYHRAEHWVVVNGTALVTRDGEEILLRENESLFLPLGCVHRLENPGRIPLNLIEVQSGPYLGEDDIVRYEDVYART